MPVLNPSLAQNAQGDQVKAVQSKLTKIGVTVPATETTQSMFGAGTVDAVKQFQAQNRLSVTGTVDPVTLAVLNNAAAVAGTNQSQVGGQLVMDYGLPANGVTVRLYSIGYGGAATKLAEAKTDANGVYSLPYTPPAAGTNVEVRAVDAQGRETTLSSVVYNAPSQAAVNLVAPASVQPLTAEFQRLSADVQKVIGGNGIQNLATAKESDIGGDLTLINQSTGWDARMVALAATAAQQSTATGLGSDVLYALFRIGMPTDSSLLAMVPSDAVQKALTKANQAGVISMTDQQISAATTAFQNFASTARLALVTPGAVSKFSELLGSTPSTFADLYFSNPSASNLWSDAAKLPNLSPQALDSLKLQGKFLYLTFNNAHLAQKLQQDIGSIGNLPTLAAKDYDLPATWQNTLTALAGTGGDQALQNLIPPIYQGKATADRLAAYSGDLARKVRISFPTHVVARMIERKDLLIDAKAAPNVSAFLRAAVPLGYSLGRTPLNTFIKNNSGNGLPSLDQASTKSLKTVHRLYQVTPSTESLQAALNLGFTSARDIASYSKEEFMNKFSGAFPPGEASLVFGRSQTVSSVTFNFFSVANQLDSSPPVYSLSGSAEDRQNAKNAIVQQFPSMSTLFGNMDYCQCDDCRSVLSPAAYFVDVLDFLSNSAPNLKTYTPLDVLIGSQDRAIPGRRPDLGALPLTCENTGTAMPYIDIVNEILEYYIANSHLDTGYAYDTGSASTSELTAEPQHILPQVYNDFLKAAVYPLTLPFDLWIETVRGFLNYFKTPLAQVLDTLRPVDDLELFTDANSHPYYRAQILSEALGFSPSEYGVLTGTALSPLATNWFKLYGYSDENTALHGKTDPTDPSQFLIPPLSSAKNLAQLLGLTYQELTDLVSTGFLNPNLYRLIFQFQRFGINMSDAFSYTSQHGFPDWTQAQYQQNKTDFEALLARITAQYKTQNPSSTFDAKTWLNNLLPVNYSKNVLVLADPDSGCNFAETTLQYADNSATSAATPLDFIKFNLFVRLWKKLGWTLDETDRAVQLFFQGPLPNWGDPNFDKGFTSAWKTALVYLAHLDDLNTQLSPALGRVALLPFWTNLPVQGNSAVYAQLFLTPSVLNNDWAFDDPNGLFPTPSSDLPPASQTFSAHQAAVQGALGLTEADIAAIFADAGASVTTVSVVLNGQNVNVPSFTLTNLSICYRYSMLAKCLQMDKVTDLISLKVVSNLHPFQSLSGAALSNLSDDILFNQTLLFVKEVMAVQNSGFTVEDLQYLLRHQFDPVGKYQSDPNALMTLVQSIANGLQQIQSQNAVPANLTSMPESLIDQTLSSLIPAPVLKALVALLTNAQTITASSSPVGTPLDPTPFAQEPQLSFSYDPTTQTQSISFQGYLLDSKKTQLKSLNPPTNFPAIFNGLLDEIQAQALTILNQRVGDILGIWASLAQYEAVRTPVGAAIPPASLVQADSAVSLSYDQTDQLQWLGYRGVLTDAKKNALLTVNGSIDLQKLLNDVQGQALSAYTQLLGTLLAMWTNVQAFTLTQSPVAAANQIDSNKFFSALASAQQAGNLTDPVPQIQLSYDSATQTQTLTCTGVLTDSMRGQLAALIPTAGVLASLLQTTRNAVVQLWQTLASNLLTVTGADLDRYVGQLVGLDAAKQLKQVKASLVSAFLPLLGRKLSRQLVLQALSANLGSDPSLTEALATDTALLTDPSNPGKSLLGAFLSLGQQGVSATYYDGGGNVLATGTAATADTADPTNNKPGAISVHFEGFLQVPTDGPYRFFAELGNAGAAALFQLDSPDPTALLSNPIIPKTPPAGADHTEVSQFVQLKGGALYHFTLDFSAIGAKGASLLIQGENLPKGPLSQIVLYPEQAVVAFTRAKVLLSKVLRILQVTAVDEREINYLIANSSQFSNLRLSSLPTQPADDSLTNAKALFSQFLTLADYADLRRGPAGGTDGIINIFENVGEPFTEPLSSQDTNKNPSAPWTAFANLTRRDAATVRAVGEYFSLITDQVVAGQRQVTAVGDFGNNKGIRRMWQALQLLQIVRIPVPALTGATVIASVNPPVGSPSPDATAANLKNTVNAQYTADTWLPIAQSVFNTLRQKKRDALVAYLVNKLQLESSNQLFEYFLVDPGMEPVVQTSRLRLAMSSVQTFIQRCLLNLEDGNSNPALNVSPSAIDTDQWEWMKRYRVWQANREIFLFPENWMEPELRLDKTDLFQALESDLLQGDVTNDLVEDAFFTYLKGLDVRARLDIVAMYLDQNPNNSTSPQTLHVLGRTYGHPHNYFYRTYSNGTWSGWVAVTSAIEGNHVTLAMWKGKLNVFWVTFIKQSQAPSTSQDSDPTHVSDLTFSGLSNHVSTIAPTYNLQVQLHWIEYFQGKWTNRISSDVNATTVIYDVRDANFDPDSNILIYVTKETDAAGNEGAVRIQLGFYRDGGWESGYAFRVTSKNCSPDFSANYWQQAQSLPYWIYGVDATEYVGSRLLAASIENQVSSGGTPNWDQEYILNATGNYGLLPCANPVVPPFVDPNAPFFDQDAGGLVAPFFFKDTSNPNPGPNTFSGDLTFFVQPSLTETTIDRWDWWAIAPAQPVQNWADPGLFDKITLIAQVPAVTIPVNPGDPVYSVYPMQNTTDWVTRPSTGISYGGSLIGKVGGIGAEKGSLSGSLGRISPGQIAGIGSGGVRTGFGVITRQGININQVLPTRTTATLARGVINTSTR